MIVPTDNEAPDGPMTGEVITPSRRKAVPLIADNNDGTVSVHYTPTELGKHQLNMKQGGKEVKGSNNIVGKMTDIVVNNDFHFRKSVLLQR